MANTDRLALPLLAVAQAQKEVTHNEALARAEIVIQAVVVSVAPASVPAAPMAGQCWIVGVGAAGAWAGQDNAIAAWTSGGWRFLSAFEGCAVWSLADGVSVRRTATAWVVGTLTTARLVIGGIQVVGAQRPRIARPVGGTTIDSQVRTTIGLILDSLEVHGLMSAV